MLIVTKFTDEQYITINQSTAGRFDPRVFVNCFQVEKCCERRLFIYIQSGDVANACVMAHLGPCHACFSYCLSQATT